MANQKLKEWVYRQPERIAPNVLHVEVIADYGGRHQTDPSFSEVRNHFYRFDRGRKIRTITETPVYAFSTLETGFWIAQEGLHSEHKDLVVFSNTAPRGDIVWHGHTDQYFACGILDNGIPIFAVNAGYNLSFVKDRLKGLWIVECPNVGTQFRSRDYYPEATMAILNGDLKKIGSPIDITKIPDVPNFVVASVDGYGNLKTTIQRSHLADSVLASKKVKVTIKNASHVVLNSLAGGKGKVGELCMVQGSSGGKNRSYIEFIKMQGRAADEFHIDGPKDDMGKILVESVKE